MELSAAVGYTTAALLEGDFSTSLVFGTYLAEVSQSLSARRQRKRGMKHHRASSEGLKWHSHSADRRHNDTLS